MTSTVPLDLAASPRDNLYAFGKTWGTFGEDPLISTFHGAMYASIGTQRLQAALRVRRHRHHQGLPFVGESVDERLQMRGKLVLFESARRRLFAALCLAGRTARFAVLVLPIAWATA